MTKPNTPLLLVILDGWGIAPDADDNAIHLAKTPNWDNWRQQENYAELSCSGSAVGLPEGQMGNSEVGHMHLGAGRVIAQDTVRINQAISNKQLSKNPTLKSAIERLNQCGGRLHLMGLLSPGGVHSHEAHLDALIDSVQSLGCNNIEVHAFLDGRDTPPKSAMASLLALEKQPHARLATVMGRYYAMDRDQRTERTQAAFNAIAHRDAEYQYADGKRALEMAYERGESDEFVKPSLIDKGHAIAPNDCILFFNFRADRARQLSYMLLEHLPNIEFLTMTRYAHNMKSQILFAPQTIENTLSEVLSREGYSQFKIAETEKYAHVTFFLNGGQESPYPKESRTLIPSPKVATYDLTPRMSAQEVTESLLDVIHGQTHDVLIVNYANADMVGHTGDFKATLEAISFLDSCLGKLAAAITEQQGQMFITADHGNAEKMYNKKTQQVHTAHTLNPVPFVYLGPPVKVLQRMGSLVDVAPTLLHCLGVPIPAQMTGHPIFAPVSKEEALA